METEQTIPVSEAMPQSVRMECAKTDIARSIDLAAITYGLTMPEAEAAAEAALGEFRKSVLAFMSIQYVKLMKNGSGVDDASVDQEGS